MPSLANKYRPKSFSDVVEQSMIVDMLSNICKSELTNRNFLFIGPAGTGKAQPLYSKVLTPEGFISMKDVKVGTTVINAEGNACKVIGTYPQGVRPIYEITTTSNNKIRVADNHLNNVWWYDQDKKTRVDATLTTMELIDKFKTSRFKLRVDVPNVNFDSTFVPIHPYLLGIMIADGSLSSGNFGLSNPEPDVIQNVQSLLHLEDYELSGGPLDWNIRHIGGTLHDSKGYCTSPLKNKFKELGLCVKSTEKHIPKEYLINSWDVRLLLLQGIFDGDGCINLDGNVEYTTCSKQLSDDFAFLVRSLGIRDAISVSKGKYKKSNGDVVECAIAYTHHLKVPNGLKFYSSEKHSRRYVDRQHEPMRNIKSIEFVGNEECKCIYVDTPSHTYISDDFIPTHNTTLGRIVGNVLNNNIGEPIEIDAASHSGVDKMRDIIQQAHSYPIGCSYKIFIVDECHSLSSQAWQALLKTLEESPAKSVFIFCTTNPEKIPATILSRVQTFQLSKISLENVYKRLVYVIEQENIEGRGIEYTDDAVNYIAKLANGGMRDALTLLDKALSYSNVISSETLSHALGLPNYDDYFTLLNAIAKKDNESITNVVHNVYNSGVNFVKWFESFHSFVINIVKYIFLQDINKTMIPSHYVDKISKYTVSHSSICLKLANKLIKMNHELKSTNYQQEIALTYLCTNAVKK